MSDGSGRGTERARAEALLRAGRLPEIGAGAQIPARSRRARDRLRRPLQRRQISLLNALTNRKALARTSNTPGRTQELNFFDVGEPVRLRLVDMPGYGFAKAPEGHGRAWRYLVNDYLRGRAVLKRTLVLIDSRHGLKEVDREMMKMLDDAAVSYRLVLTKARQDQGERARRGLRARPRWRRAKHPAAHPDDHRHVERDGHRHRGLRAAVLEAALHT